MKWVGLYDYRKIIASEHACFKLIRKIRWPHGVRCPRCNFSRTYHYLENNVPKHRCKRCNYKFTDITGTVFQRTKIPLSKWILAIALFKIGISANQLAKEIGVAYRIAWSLMHRFRSAVEKDPLFTKLQGIIEMDETYFGGRQHRNKRLGKTGFTNKVPVIGIRSRNGKVKTIAVSRMRSRQLKSILQRWVESGSTIYTDDYKLHRRLSEWGYNHEIINKLLGFVREPDIHINAAEGYWLLSKTKLYARHHQMSRKYLPKYLAEIEHKFNYRKELDFIRLIINRLIFGPLSE